MNSFMHLKHRVWRPVEQTRLITLLNSKSMTHPNACTFDTSRDSVDSNRRNRWVYFDGSSVVWPRTQDHSLHRLSYSCHQIRICLSVPALVWMVQNRHPCLLWGRLRLVFDPPYLFSKGFSWQQTSCGFTAEQEPNRHEEESFSKCFLFFAFRRCLIIFIYDWEAGVSQGTAAKMTLQSTELVEIQGWFDYKEKNLWARSHVLELKAKRVYRSPFEGMKSQTVKSLNVPKGNFPDVLRTREGQKGGMSLWFFNKWIYLLRLWSLWSLKFQEFFLCI